MLPKNCHIVLQQQCISHVRMIYNPAVYMIGILWSFGNRINDFS